MEGAAGSADKEMDVIRASISFKLNELSQTWVGIWQELLERGNLAEFIESLTKASNGFGKAITNLSAPLNLLLSLLSSAAQLVGELSGYFKGFAPVLGIAGISFAKNFGKPKLLAS